MYSSVSTSPTSSTLQVSKRQVYLEKGFAYVPRTQLATLVQGAFRAKLSKDLAIAYKSASLIQSDERIAPLVRNLGRIAYRMGRAASAVDSESVLSTFSNYLAEIGHSQPKAKPAGQDRFYIAVGYRKANDKDRMCPIAGRVHKSNTQKYTVYCDTQVMMQGCWYVFCFCMVVVVWFVVVFAVGTFQLDTDVDCSGFFIFFVLFFCC